MINIQETNFANKSALETSQLLNTDPLRGLTYNEAKARQTIYGENKLKEKKKKSVIRIFFEQMKNPMIYILFAAIAVTIGVSIYEMISAMKAGNPVSFFAPGDWPDVVIILAVIFLNAVIGTIQEKKADSSLEALKKLSSPLVNILRDGEITRVKAAELTIGDVIIFEEGEVIGADLRIVEAYNLKINESSLTGESVASEKDANLVFSDGVPLGDRVNMAYASTVVAYGRGKGIVTAIGMNTEIGKIADSINNDETELTPLQKILKKLSKFLGLLTIAIVAIVFIVDMVWIFVDGKGGLIDEWINAVLNSIALAVAAIPEGLVAVVTIVLSIGVTRMVKANTIVRKLPSVETLGSVNVICSDKTGTLTQNHMTVVEAYVSGHAYKQDAFTDNKDLTFLATGLALCSNATKTFGDPTEIALIDFADALHLDKAQLESKYPRTDELPFDSVRKMMSTKNGQFIFTKGAFDEIIKRSKHLYHNGKTVTLTKNDIETLTQLNSEYSSHGLRVLALAFTLQSKIEEEDLIFLGLVAMIDPPRVEVPSAVSKLKGAGIRTIMITGDHIDTAYAIANQLGISEDSRACLSGPELDALSFDELREKVKYVNVYGRVSPQNKVDIVKALKMNGQVVAMTGDGVNDAPSLKGADIGIAMGITGTDVAKDASDMILTDDNFASIERAVEEGRGIYTNIRKTVLFLLSSNISEVFSMFVIICLGLPTPLIAIHLLWVNLLTDSAPAIALGVDPKDENVMQEKPRDSKETFFSKGGLNFVLIYGALITIAVIIAFLIPAWQKHAFTISEIKIVYSNINLLEEGILLRAQTMAFSTLAIAEIFQMLFMSDVKRSFINVFKKKNKVMLLAFIFGIGLQVFVVLTPGVNNVFKTYPIQGMDWLWVFVLALIPLLVHEFTVLFKKMFKKR